MVSFTYVFTAVAITYLAQPVQCGPAAAVMGGASMINSFLPKPPGAHKIRGTSDIWSRGTNAIQEIKTEMKTVGCKIDHTQVKKEPSGVTINKASKPCQKIVDEINTKPEWKLPKGSIKNVGDTIVLNDVGKEAEDEFDGEEPAAPATPAAPKPAAKREPEPVAEEVEADEE